MSDKKQIEFLKLYEPVHERFEKFCRARVYGEMEYSDLMNETLLIAFSKLDDLKSKTSFLSFLFGVSIRLLANQNRKSKGKEKIDVNEVVITDLNANTDENADVTMLYEALSLLPSDQKESLILFEIVGYSIKEIMAVQNSSESAIKQRLKRGRVKLTEILTFESKYKRGEVKV